VPYFRGKDDGWIYLPRVDDGTEGSAEPLCVFPYEIAPHSGFVEASGVESFKFSFRTLEAERVETKTFNTNILSDQTSFMKAFLGSGFPIVFHAEQSRKFFMSYTQQLRNANDTMVTAPAFGWSPDRKNHMGFSFNGRYVSPLGELRCKRPGDGEKEYRAYGLIDPWYELANVILTPDRPDLAVLVAGAFAAPLLEMSGFDGYMLGVWSPSSGIGKTTAIKLGQAVWGQPVISGLADTVNYTFAKAAALRHLPLYYDEIKGAKQIQNFCDIIFQMSGGHDKGRADRGGHAKLVKEFRTAVIYASNASMLAAARIQHIGTDAHVYRMLELKGVNKPDMTKHSIAEVGQMVQALMYNYGCIGLEYAEFLGKNHANIQNTLQKQMASLQKTLGYSQEERFWGLAIASIILGAQIATGLGFAQFPVNEMYRYLVNGRHEIAANLVKTSGNFEIMATLLHTISTFVNAKLNRNMLIIDRTWNRPARPPVNYVKVLNEPRQSANWGPHEVSLSGDPLVLRFFDTTLTAWCKQHDMPKASLVASMEHNLGAVLGKFTLGAGTPWSGGQAKAWEIKVTGGPLEEVLAPIANNYAFLPP
jgi:Domain of unknown function (DUF927)